MTEEFEHPSEVPEPLWDEAGGWIDLTELAKEEPAKEPHKEAEVVQLNDYRDLAKQAAEAERKIANGEVELTDEELGAKMLARVEFDEQKAIDRVKNKKWLVYGVIPHEEVGFIYGRPGSYKSFMAVDLASHVASASKWNGIDVDLPGAVLYIAAEGGAELHLRKKAWRMKTGNDNSAIYIMDRRVIINSPTERAELKAAMRVIQKETGHKFVLVVIDTFSKCFSGNENDAGEMGSFIAGCEEIRDEFNGCSVLFVGHTSKANPDAMRGSVAALGDCAFSYRIKRGKEKFYAEMHCDKLKEAIEPDDMAFEFEVVKTGDVSAKGLDLSSLVPKMTAMLERSDEEEFAPGRAEKPAYEQSASSRVKAILMSQLRMRSAQENGSPQPRMVVRDDVMNILMNADEMKESTAKTQWRRAVDELLAEGMIIKCDGDMWMPKKGA